MPRSVISQSLFLLAEFATVAAFHSPAGRARAHMIVNTPFEYARSLRMSSATTDNSDSFKKVPSLFHFVGVLTGKNDIVT
jgi:hypothetical protein